MRKFRRFGIPAVILFVLPGFLLFAQIPIPGDPGPEGPDPVPPLRTFQVDGITAALGEMLQFDDGLLGLPPDPVPPPPDPGMNFLGTEFQAAAPYPAAPVTPPAAGIIAPPAAESFAGLSDNNDSILPAAQGAAGLDHLVTILDRGFAVFDKTTGVPVGDTISLQAFWSPLGSDFGQPAFAPFDPRVIFDQYLQRWLIVAPSNSRGPYSHILVAISADADPGNGFTLFAIPADPAAAAWVDSAALGVDYDHYYITGNMHRVDSDVFVDTRAWVLDKEAFLSGGPLVVHEFSLPGGHWRPAHAFGSTAVNYLISSGWTPGGTTQYARIHEVSFPSGTPATTDLGYIRLADYGDTIPDAIPQPGCAEPITGGGFRLRDAVLRNGRIWTVHVVDTPPGLGEAGKAEIAWYEIAPGAASLFGPFGSPARQGRIRDPQLHFINPSIAVNVNETVAFGFSGAGTGHFPGAYFAIRQPTDPDDVMPAVRMLKEGVSPYFDTVGGNGNVWGRSSTTVLDPDDNRTFWTLQHYARQEAAPGCPADSSGSWGTWWGSFASCQTHSHCNDGLFCDGLESCDAATGHCLAGTGVICPDDGQVCTMEICNEELDSCNTPAPDDETAAGPDGSCSSTDDNPTLYGPDSVCGTADDEFGDGLCNPIDNCVTMVNPDQTDLDGDGRGDLCDNCLNAMNYHQEDRDADGAGDACQPFISIAGFVQDGGDTVRADTVLFDPQGQPLSGEIEVTVEAAPVAMETLYPDFDCTKTFRLDAPNGPGMVYFTVSGKSSLQDAQGFSCPATGRVEFGLGRCDDPGLPFAATGIDLTGLPVPLDLCVRPVSGAPDGARQFRVTDFDAFTLDLTPIEAVRQPFTDSLLPAVSLPPGSAGGPVLVTVSATDGETPETRDSAGFVSQGESLLVFQLNSPPLAVAGADQVVDCAAAAGATVLLDASGSQDPDSGGGSDSIVLYEWFRDAGTAAEVFLGFGETLAIDLPPGTHPITLRVTDSFGATASDDMIVTVNESPGPDFTVSLAPIVLWPPNHRMVDVDAVLQIDSTCGVAAVELVSVVSDELDDDPAAGDGRTVGDIEGAETGTPDQQFRLRAERDSLGSGRTYSVTYQAFDPAGKAAAATATVAVPRDLGGITEPVNLDVRETAAGTVVEWNPVPGAFFYNLVRGEVKNLRDAGRHYDLGPVTCLAGGITATTILGAEDTDLPPIGEAFFYLVEYNDGLASSYGTVNAAKPRLAPSGPGNCP